MKKLMTLILTLTMVTAIAAGCAGNGNDSTTDDTGTGTTGTNTQVAASALEVLTTIWAGFTEEERFPVYGGDGENMVNGAPGNYNLQDAQSLGVQLLVPADQVQNITEAASLFHGMMSNNFSCGVFRLAQGVSAVAFADTMYGAVEHAQWLCGTPEKTLIAVIGEEYVLMAFGLQDVIDRLQTKTTAAYTDAQIKYAEAITG